MMSVTGEPGVGHGVRCGVSIADMQSGMYAAFGIMLALRVKERTGRWQFIDVSMLEGQLCSSTLPTGRFSAMAPTLSPWGPRTRHFFPIATFRTKTRDLALAVGSEKLWKAFCPAYPGPGVADDPRYRTNADRLEIAMASSPSSRTSS